MTLRLASLIGLIFLVGFSRWIPHPPNFSPVIALGLFAGAYFKSRTTALLAVWGSLFFGDLLIGFHSTMFFVYAPLAFVVGLGHWVSPRWSFSQLTGGVLGSSLLFFVVSNFGVWWVGELYPRTLAGLQECFYLAIPFFSHTLASTALFASGLFYGFRFLEIRLSSLKENCA